MNKHIACVLVTVALVTGVLTGCAAPQPVVAAKSAEAFDKALAEADQVAAVTATQDLGIQMFEKIAADYPARSEPWSRIAQVRFAQENHGLAIVAAEETLKRDPANRQAKSVVVVGGLRLATRSLEELRKDSDLTGDSKRDAYRLAALLRETLGTAELVPTEKAKPRPASRPRQAMPSVSASATALSGAVTTSPVPSIAPAANAAKPAGGNPFGALK